MRFCALQENVVCKQLTLISPGNNVSSDQCVVDYKSLNGLGKQSGFSIVTAVQYCSVARERAKTNAEPGACCWHLSSHMHSTV